MKHSSIISDINEKKNENVYNCQIIKTNKGKPQNLKKDVFFKFAPLFDPIDYLYGRFNDGKEISKLPSFEDEVEKYTKRKKFKDKKLNDVNNKAYTDGFFYYLSNKLLEKHYFPHAIEFYGSFLGTKRMYKCDIYSDMENLFKDDYFVENKNIIHGINEEQEKMINSDFFSGSESITIQVLTTIHQLQII